VIALALQRAAIALHPTRARLATALRIACELRCAAGDGSYLALALDPQRPLVTADLRLVRASRGDRAGRLAMLVVPLGA
jgi:predicted nucleic acid-binding protein